MQASSSRPSDIVRRVRKGDTQLVASTQGRRHLRLDAYTQTISGLDWRDLGALLAQLTEALDSDKSSRSVSALAATALHMHGAKGEGNQANAAFVTAMFGRMVEACARSVRAADRSPVYPVVRCIARCVRSPQTAFDPAAVLAGITAGACESDSARRKKRRRRIAGEADLCVVLTCALDSTSNNVSASAAIRVLRANDVLRYLALSSGTKAVSELCHALVMRGCDSVGSQTQETGDLFACIRDIVPLVGSADSAQEDGTSVELLLFEPVGRLMELLVKRVFRPLLADSGALYRECARLRVRCYQWAALCRMTTWLALAQPTGTAAAAVAEGAHVCWLQIVLGPPRAEVDDSMRSVWLLLLSESLAHTACLYPQQQQQQQKQPKQNALFLQTEESQIRVFTAVASLLAVLPLELKRIAGEESPLALLYSCVASCERLLVLVRPRAASMGLFWLHGTASRAKEAGIEEEEEEEEKEEATSFDFGKTTPAKYIFSAQQSEESIDRSAADDIVRIVGEEAVHEERIVGVFAGLDAAVQAMSAEDGGRLAVLCVRTSLLWIRMFASGARDNVGWQTRVLESLRSAHKPATDWARLQRIPVASNRQARSDGKPISTFRPMVARVLRFLMALAAWPFLKADSGDAQGLLLLQSEEHMSVIERLATLVPLRDLNALSFSALQILASVAGVRLRLFSNTRDPSDLRPPHVQVRDRTPPSSEALLHLAMQLGATTLLLHPRLLVRAIECLDPATRTAPPPDERTFVSLQIWLDIVGAVVRHSFFRSFLDAAAFRRWWCLALAASVRSIARCCRLGVAARDLRMALLVPMHLASWQQYLDTAGTAIRGFTHIMPLLASDNEKVCQDDARLFSWFQSLNDEALPLFPEAMATPGSSSCSILPIVYFCACKLWLSVPVLATEPSEADRPMVARVCRDIWGIAAEMLHLLVRILHQHLSVFRLFVAPRSGLVEDFAAVLSTLTAGHVEFPCVVANIVASNSGSQSPAQRSSSDKNGKDEDEEDVESSDLITIPLFDSDPPIKSATAATTSPSYTLSSENDNGGGPSSAPGDEDSVVDRLLRQTAHQSASGPTTHKTRTIKNASLEEYYSNPMLAILWTNYTDQLKQFPCSLIFSRTTKTTAEPAEVDMARWLEDPDNVLRRLFVPLLSSVKQQHRLCNHPSALWAAMAQTFPEQSILRTMHHASTNHSVFLRMSESAAFLLPLSAAWSTQMSTMLECLVAHAAATNESDALLFLALRRRDTVLRNVRLCARQLDGAAEYAASTLSESLHSAEEEQKTAVALSGYNIDPTLDEEAPVPVPLGFLVRQSDVFRAMLTGPFREAAGVSHRDSADQKLRVQSDHATLVDLFAIVRAMDQQRSLLVSAAQLESSYSVERLAECLRLADFYDMRLLVVVLVWFFIDRVVGRAHVVPADSAVWLLSVLYRDNNALVAAFDGLADPSAAVKALGAVVLLCSDQLDLPDIIDGNVELFVETLRFVFTDSE